MTPAGRTWTIATTSGYTASGYLPAWAEEDPSRTGVRPERLDIELSGLTHEAAFGGQFMRVCPAAVDPGQDSVVFAGSIQCGPHVGDDLRPRDPVVNIQLVDDLWLIDLDPAGVAEVAAHFHDFAELLLTKVVPELSAARADWAPHHPVGHPQASARPKAA